MNPDEAKVPNVEKDWQSIEIFLFSNGQQYSPPRKYLLRVDELNLWDATLNLLAQSHYGLQSPFIHLYTTNGQLVNGPLDLRDGQAYVAVVPPDTFVDAGYQKYLIRASRSWEKRQARKKPQACVPDEPCCLCPERERSCCDPQACCLCPEREDAVSLEDLLPATGHPELRPAGGHYMSSAPTKPVAEDVYEPVSGKNGRMSCEHCENRATLREYGYSPVPPTDNTNGYVSRPDEYAARPAEHGANQDGYETRPGSKGVKSGEYGAESCEHGARPSINGGKAAAFGVRVAEDETKPTVIEVMPVKYGATQGAYETTPIVNGAKTGEYRAGPGDETKPSVNGTKLGEYGAKTSLNGVKPGEYGARPCEYETRQSFNGAKPGEFGARPAEYGIRPGDYETNSTVNDTKQAEYETRSSVNGITHSKYENEYRPIPGEFEIKASVNGANQGEYGMRRDENKIKTSINGVNQDEVGTKPAEYETKPRVNGAKPGENGARQVEYETKPSGNEPKPDDFLASPVEYATRSAEQENRPDEYVRPVKNGSWSGEYGDRTTSHKARPGHSGPWSGKIDPIKEAYETALREKEKSLKENEDRPDKETVVKDASIKYVNEYKTREVDQRNKEIEPKDWSRGNGVSGGERRVSGGDKNNEEKDTVTGPGESKARKNENARKLSARGGPEIEHGARTGEPSKEFEHGSRVSAQKAREINPAGRASGQAARLSAQKNKQNENFTRVVGRENRVGDHEARAGDIGFQTSGHDAGLENTGSTEAEPGARAAVSVLRGNPRDKVSSRPKIGHLGHPRIGKPGTKLDEPAVKLDDLDIKRREGNPGARQNRVGATGTAGVLNISEAQQQARRNTLSTGRPTVEKKRLSIGQNSSLPRKPHPNSSILRKTEDRQPIKSNKENQPKKMNEKASLDPVPASNNTGKIKTPALPPPTISITNIASVTKDKDPLDNVIDEKEIIVVSTHSLKNPESETKSMMLDSVKHVVDAINSSQEETQTELIYIERSMAYISVNEGVQTNTEEVEKQGQEVSTSKEKDNSCTCSLCKQPNHKTSDPDENTLSILNKGGVVNIKLNIEVRNIVKSVYSCHKNCGRSQSLINVPRPEKKSEISIEDDVLNRTSLQSLFTKQNFGGFGFEGSPKVMVVQCAGCGRLNTPPQCDPPPCCDSNKKYFVLLNSVLEDKEDGCNFIPPCRPCDQRQSRRQSSGIPIKQAFSESTLDTITTVTVSGVPLQRREMGKCGTSTSCQTDEPQNECMTTKRKVSITQDSVTKCDLQKKSSSSDCVATQAVSLLPQQSYLKMFSQKIEYEDSQTCADLCRVVRPTTYEKIRPNCSQVRQPTCEKVSPPSCEKVGLVCSQVRPPTCEKVQPNCSQVPPPACEKRSPPSCENVQSDCSQVPPSTCEKVRSICSEIRPTCEEIRPNCSQVPPPTCEKVSPPSCEKVRSVCSQVRPPTCEKVRPNCLQVPLPCENVQSDCSRVPPSTCENVRQDCSQVRSPKYENVRSNCSQEPLPICEKVRSVCLQVTPLTCEKVRSLCSQVSSQTFSQVQTKGCQPLGPQIQSQGCQPMCRPCCPKPPPQVLQHSNAETQTRWTSILARLHCDGRYSFHLPPLHVLKSNCHSCCQ